MSKWRIPRHRPKGVPEWEREDRNHSKAFTRKRKHREERQAKEMRRNLAFLDLVCQQTNKPKAHKARQMMRQCERKKKLTLQGARLCARSAALESGSDVYAYKCKWCGAYHLTSHPIKGATYDVHYKGFPIGDEP